MWDVFGVMTLRRWVVGINVTNMAAPMFRSHVISFNTSWRGKQ